MKAYVTTDMGTNPAHHLLEDAISDSGRPIVRKWQIIQPFKQGDGSISGWIIQSGLTKRLIFPIDFEDYYVE